LKPTFGRVAAYPPSGFGTLAHIGPIARSADDAAAMLNAMAGRDPDDWNQGIGELPPLALSEGVLKGARIGLWTNPAHGTVDTEVAAAIAKAARSLEALGAHIEPVELPGEDLTETFRIHWYAGAANRFGAVPKDLVSLCDPGFVEVARNGASIPASALVAAQLRRTAFGAAMEKLLAKLDFIVSPATAIPAFAVPPEVPSNVALDLLALFQQLRFPDQSQPAAGMFDAVRPDRRRPADRLQFVAARGGCQGPVGGARFRTREPVIPQRCPLAMAKGMTAR
jgi:amidase/aspartyl-tRNA(Asn)/glutamyl-tRNA(Gln) amidotransferase subunit A